MHSHLGFFIFLLSLLDGFALLSQWKIWAHCIAKFWQTVCSQLRKTWTRLVRTRTYEKAIFLNGIHFPFWEAYRWNSWLMFSECTYTVAEVLSYTDLPTCDTGVHFRHSSWRESPPLTLCAQSLPLSTQDDPSPTSNWSSSHFGLVLVSSWDHLGIILRSSWSQDDLKMISRWSRDDPKRVETRQGGDPRQLFYMMLFLRQGAKL